MKNINLENEAGFAVDLGISGCMEDKTLRISLQKNNDLTLVSDHKNKEETAMKSIQILHRWDFLARMRQRLTPLRDRSTGPEAAMYRALLLSCNNEMIQLTPQIDRIIKKINKQTVLNDIAAIYFEDRSFQDWAETRGVSVETVYDNIMDALKEIDRELNNEAA